MSMMNLTEQIIKYENGNMEEPELIKFFQHLIDTGVAWQLQGHYGRMAMHLVEEGFCSTHTLGDKNEDTLKI